MMEYKNDKLSARFVVPDKITVRQQLAYFSLATSIESEKLVERLWAAGQPLITEWECASFPDLSLSLDQCDDPRVTDVIIWAALQIKGHINNLDKIPKNS